MPSLIDIIIRGSDQSGPAFASAATHLARLTAGADQSQAHVRQLGTAMAATGTQASSGLARIEQQAEGSASAIITLGIAGSTTATRMRSLTVSIINQEQRLDILAQVLRETAAGHDADSVAVRRAQFAYDSLNRTLANNRARMQDLRSSGDVSGISVVGIGAGAGVGGLAGRAAAAQGALQTLGLGLGVAEALRMTTRWSTESITLANNLEKTQATLRALSGTQERYTEVLALARRNQALYGGSTQDTLSSFRALVPLANAGNAALRDLDQTTRLLAASMPEQGVEGAAFGLREYLTGRGAEGSQSLAERFNLDKQTLTAGAAASTEYADRLRVVNAELERLGINQRLLDAQANTTAATYDRFASSYGRFQEAAGSYLAERFRGPAEVAAGVMRIATGDWGGLKDIQTGYTRGGEVRAAQYEQYRQGVGAYMSGQPVTVNNITIEGSLVTEKQLADTVRRINAQTAARNGTSFRR